MIGPLVTAGSIWVIQYRCDFSALHVHRRLLGVASRQWIGVDNIMWSSDYPHTTFTLPHPRDIIERDFSDTNELAKRKIVREKVAQLYGFELD